MKNYFKLGTGIVGLCLTVGCVSIVLWNGGKPKVEEPIPAAVDLQNDVSLRQECATLFREIIKIQDDREALRRNLNKTQQAFHQGETSQDMFAQARVVWLESENSLATEAAGLYTAGRTKGCFQKVEH